jgi:hypothetical protein
MKEKIIEVMKKELTLLKIISFYWNRLRESVELIINMVIDELEIIRLKDKLEGHLKYRNAYSVTILRMINNININNKTYIRNNNNNNNNNNNKNNNKNNNNKNNNNNNNKNNYNNNKNNKNKNNKNNNKNKKNYTVYSKVYFQSKTCVNN